MQRRARYPGFPTRNGFLILPLLFFLFFSRGFSSVEEVLEVKGSLFARRDAVKRPRSTVPRCGKRKTPAPSDAQRHRIPCIVVTWCALMTGLRFKATDYLKWPPSFRPPTGDRPGFFVSEFRLSDDVDHPRKREVFYHAVSLHLKVPFIPSLKPFHPKKFP